MSRKPCEEQHIWLLEDMSPHISEKGNLFIFCSKCGVRVDSGISIKMYKYLGGKSIYPGKKEVLVLDEQGFFVRSYF